MTTRTGNTVHTRIDSRQFISAIENERAQIARELHDDISQRLAINAIEVRLLYNRISRAEPEIREHLMRVYSHLMEVANDVGGLSRRLHPSIVIQLGVVGAIRAECENLTRLSGTQVHFECQCHLRNVPECAALALFRITQQALRNIAKHAPRASVHVTLQRINHDLQLCIEDDGGGFDPEHCRCGLGLVSMRERAKLVGGSLNVRSSPGNGTRVEAFIPVTRSPIKHKSQETTD